MPDNVVDVAKRINAISKAITSEGMLSTNKIKADAEADSAYDKALAIKGLALKASDMPVTLIPMQARGDGSDEKYKMLVAKGMLKAHWERLRYLEAQLSAQQSIYKHLSHTG